MRLFRYEMTWKDGMTEFGMAFGADERDVADYVTYGVREHLSRIHVAQDDDLTWPSADECPCYS